MTFLGPMTRRLETGGANWPTRLNLLSLVLLLLTGTIAIEIVTAGPPQEALEVRRISFQTWRSPGMPSILVTLNQPVTRASLRRHLFFLVDGLERLPITLEPMEESPGLENRQWLVQPVAEMPSDTQIRLRLKPDLLSPMGTKAGVTPRTVVEFHTFPTPRFLGIECSNNSGLLIRIYTPTSHSPSQGCNPLSRISLVFSSPVTREMLRRHLVFEPGLDGEFGDGEFEDSPRIPGEFLGLSPNSTPLNRPRKKGEEYKILLPQVLKAATNYHLGAPASEILDEFGQPLPSDIDFNFPTNNRPPSLVMTHPISILERQVRNHLPVTLTNIGELDVKFQRLTSEGIERSQITVAVEPRNLSDSPSSAEIERLILGKGKNSLIIPSPLAGPSNISYRFPLKVREWLKERSGALFGHLSTDPFTGPPRWFFSEVTPFHVHLKLGHDNSLVWVTDLATGKPVEGAQVQIYRDRVSAMTARPTPLTAGVTRVDGTAFLDGTDVLDPTLGKLDHRSPLYDPDGPGELFFLRVDHGEEIALLPLADEFSVLAEVPHDDQMPTGIERLSGPIRSWGTTAQGLYRTGDTVQFKIYVRDQQNQSFGPAPAKGYHLQVIDPMNKVTYQVKDLELNDFGAYHGEFEVPRKGGAVGWYQFQLKADFIPNEVWKPMRVLVGPSTEAGLYTGAATAKDTVRPMNQSKLRHSSLGDRNILGGPGHHLLIEPEKAEYQVGETARIQIQNPFPGAHALFTVERLGVQQSWSRVLKSDTELVEFEITPEHFPGLYFSATVMSPRADQPLGKGEMRMSKPTVRMGYIGLAVRDPHKEITVEVRPRRSTYRPGEKVTVDLVAALLHPLDREERLPQMELAVVVLDEALFNRLARNSEAFDPYQGFYNLQPLDLQNFNLLTPLIGIQELEKKTLSRWDGGDARPDLGSMFPFVGYWDPSLLTDASGRATVEFQAPDNLTGWRILAMAVTSGDRMGLGEGRFTVHQPRELLRPLEKEKEREKEQLLSPPI